MFDWVYWNLKIIDNDSVCFETILCSFTEVGLSSRNTQRLTSGLQGNIYWHTAFKTNKNFLFAELLRSRLSFE